MLMKKKDEPDPSAKKAEEDEEELQDNYKEDKPPEKTPEPTTKPVWRAPASRQMVLRNGVLVLITAFAGNRPRV
jgi:hypothetical protein